MKENKYDDPVFFEKYSGMDRSKKGLSGAGEWHALKKMLPEFKNRRVLDLGCGFGWHCKYAEQNGATEIIGLDISENMLETAKSKNGSEKIKYIQGAIEDIEFPDSYFEVVMSSLAIHYVKSFEDVCNKVSKILKSGGSFVFSAEHPVFTAEGSEDWIYDEDGNIMHWPVDNYFCEGKRSTCFLGENVVKYHRTLSTYINTLIKSGFNITGVTEPEPDNTMMDIPGMKDELRRPMMIIISAVKK